MKKKLYLVTILILGVIAIAMVLMNGVGKAQNVEQDQHLDMQSTIEPGQEDSSGVSWNTSAELPEGVQVQSPPDRLVGVDPVDAAERASYNASLRIAGSVLRPRTMESGLEWRPSSDGGCLYVLAGSQYIWFNTPLYLPQGSTIKYFRMYYNDQSASYNSAGYLTVYDLYGNIVVEFGVFSSGTGKDYVTTVELEHVVDYDQYSYVINWRPNSLGSTQQVCGFRIYYQTPTRSTYLPLIEKDN